MSDPEKLIRELAARTLTLALLPLLAGVACAAGAFLCPAPREVLAVGCGGAGAVATAVALALRHRAVRGAAKQAAVAAVDPPLGGAEAVRLLRSLRKLTEEAHVVTEARVDELEKAVAEVGSLLREAAGLHVLMGEKLCAAEEACRRAAPGAGAVNEVDEAKIFEKE